MVREGGEPGEMYPAEVGGDVHITVALADAGKAAGGLVGVELWRLDAVAATAGALPVAAGRAGSGAGGRAVGKIIRLCRVGDNVDMGFISVNLLA